jgi:tetratricopeptide (TPR) repeat protein
VKQSIKIFSLLFIVNLAKAQDTLNSALVNQKTFDLYVQKNWKELDRQGINFLKRGYDYYYLRMRVGIAYYERKNYCLAEKHFAEALHFNSHDELAMEYLYYCYIFTGRREDARWLSKKFTADLARKVGVKSDAAVSDIFVEGGTKLTDSSAYYDKMRKEKSNYYNPSSYFHIGLTHYVQNRFSLFHGITLYSQDNFTGSIKQNQYYIKAAVPLRKNWMGVASFHAINIHVTSSIPNQPPHRPGMPPRQQTSSTTISNYIAATAAAQKFFGRINVGVGATFTNMYGTNLLIHYGTFSYYIFGNSKVVAGATAYLHTSDSYSSFNYALSPFLYLQPIDKFSAKISYFRNSGSNIIEDNGYVVNNSPDITNSRTSILLNYYCTKHFTIYALLQKEYKTEKYQLFNYNYNVIVGGVRFWL